MSRTKLGSFVVCDSPQLLAEEAPECYKDVDAIIATLQEAYGVNVIAVMKPVVTIKQ
jgi:release factor H-coupled RctB family protein